MAKRTAMIEMAPALGRDAGAISDVRSGRLGGGIAGQALFKTCLDTHAVIVPLLGCRPFFGTRQRRSLTNRSSIHRCGR